MLLRVLLSALCGVLLSTGFEPLGWYLLVPPAVAGLAVAVHGLSPSRAWIPGLAFGIGFFFTLQWWMRAVGTDAWLGLSGLEAVFLAPLAAFWAWLQRENRWWPWWSAVAWVAVETVRSSWPFSGMPWGRLSYAVADTWWAEGLPRYGFVGVSLLLALTGTTLAWLVTERPGVRSGAVAVLPLAVLTVVPVLWPWQAQESGTARVAVVQGDVPGAGDDLVSVHREVTENHVRATEELGRQVAGGAVARPDFVLWPENSTAVDPFRDVRTRTAIDRAVAAVGVPVVVGAMVDDERSDRVLNQGIVWNPVTGAADRYSKWHPVPFGEYVPWRDLVFKQNLGRLQQIGRDMLSGTRATPLDVAGLEVADAICFDVAYDDGIHAQVRRGAQLLVVQTSNAMFIHTAQVEQQYAITRLRALETGRSLAVASTNGVSGVVGADGRTVERAPVRSTTTLVQEVPLASGSTPAVVMGLWPGRLAVLSVAVLLVLPGVTRAMAYIRRRPVTTPEP